MKTKILTLAILASLVATGCSKDETTEHPSSYPADGVIRVATTVTETRAGMTTANLSNMGFFVTNNNSATYSYKNVKMTFAESKWSSETMMLWKNSTEPVQISAYSPYVAGATDLTAVPFSVQTDQSIEENVKASDFVYDKHSDFTPANQLKNGYVPLALHHVLSKLVVTIKLGTEFNVSPGTTENPIADVTVNGTIVSCMLNFQNNADLRPQDLRGEAMPILMYQDSYTAGVDTTSNATAKYECILLPQTVAAGDFTIDIFIPGKGNYKYTLAVQQEFEVLHIYSLALTVGKDQVTAGDITMGDWDKVWGDNHETE